MRRIVDAPALRDQLSRGALDQAHRFTWDGTAERTIEVYRAAEHAMRLDLGAIA
jgi:D-inositol-3-phosphate glycosyltransferase